MTCQPEKVTGLVDGALDAAESAAIEQHVAACADCRAQADFERGLRRQLAGLRAPEPADTLEPRLRRRLAAGRRPSRARVWLPIAAALAAVAIWAHGSAAVLGVQLAWDHDHCFGKDKLPAKVWTADSDTMAAWLEANGSEAPSLPESAGGLDLVGGRRCPLLDRRVGHVYYANRDDKLSVFVVPGWVRMDTPRRQMRSGDKTVRLVRTGGRLVALVSESGEAIEAFERALTTAYARR